MMRIVELELPMGEWQNDAQCRDIVPEELERFFGSDIEQRAVTQEYCADCPVKDECLEYAIANSERMGVWGGTTVKQRNKLIQRYRRLQREMLSA